MQRPRACFVALLLTFTLAASSPAAAPDRKEALYGAAYYEEYAPYDRLQADIEMMKTVGINVVRIAESTWSTLEPQDGVFDYSHIDRVIKAVTPNGQNRYGPRQKMDITNPHFRFYAERVIRHLVERVKNEPAVIGFQIDNETKSYGVSGPDVQRGFVAFLKQRFQTLDALNHAYGLDYWSNRINAWEDFPPIEGAVNASLTSAFAEYQRKLVTDYLAWQAGIVRRSSVPISS